MQHPAVVIQRKAAGQRFIPLIHVEILDLLPCQFLSVQNDGHFPGQLPKAQLQACGLCVDKGFILQNLRLRLSREGKYCIAARGNSLREHGKAEYGFLRERDSDACPVAAERTDLERNAVRFRLIGGDGIQKILVTLGRKMAVALFQRKRIGLAQFGTIAPPVSVVNLNHGISSFSVCAVTVYPISPAPALVS